MRTIKSGIYVKLEKELLQRKRNESFRSLKQPNQNLIDFSSNDYLGLAKSEELFSLINNTNKKSHTVNGATGSRLLTGNSAYAETVEKNLAKIFKSENALLFNSGYTANLAVLSSIPQKGDTILYDELSHACIKDGARLSLAKRYSFKHNDLDDLEKKISVSTGQLFFVVESIYSMDGDFCPLEELVVLKKKYDAVIIVDEAHSTGLLGENGSGYSSSLGLEKEIDIRIHTFGKAMGIHGACVCGPKTVTNYLINFARPFIYTTALPPHSIVSIDCAFDFLGDHIQLQSELEKNISLFLEQTNGLDSISENKSCIQFAIIPGNASVKSASDEFHKNGFDVRPILSPTVPKGKERLRICLHTFNTEEEITRLAQLLKSLV